MGKLKGETKLTVVLKKQKAIDSWLLIGLIILSISYGIQNQISAFTLYLLSTCVILAVYLAFFVHHVFY